MPYNPNTLGSFLKKKRKEYDLTITQVSIGSGTSTSNISNIETGKFQSPTLLTLTKLADFYGLNPLDLVEMIDLPSENTLATLKVHLELINKAMSFHEGGD